MASNQAILLSHDTVNLLLVYQHEGTGSIESRNGTRTKNENGTGTKKENGTETNNGTRTKKSIESRTALSSQ